jgi:hypothetical protein
MVIEILRACIFAGLPLFAITYLLINSSVKSKRLGSFNTVNSLESASREMSKQYKKEKKEGKKQLARHLILNKWMSFGGGFYGLMVLVTFLTIEAIEVFQFFGKLFASTWAQIFSSLTIDMLVNLLINAIMNFVAAFVWFTYWPKMIEINNGWIWILIAYIAYFLGAHIAQRFPYSRSKAE